MDDLFGMLYSDLDPQKKLLTAVTSNMIDSLDKLAASGTDLDQTLHHHNGNRAIHIASMKGHKGCVRKLLEYGADADATNRFGFTPLSTALRSGHSGCAQTLLAHGSATMDPDLVWNAQNMDGTPPWLAYNVECLKVLINATSCFSRYLSNHEERRLVHACQSDPELIRLFYLCGNKFSDSQAQSIMSSMDESDQKWIKDFRKCRSLQHYSRCVIRRNLHPNVYSGSRKLPIPPTIQEYLLITDLSNPLV